MNFAFANGTPRQQALFSRAISACSYPFNAWPQTVTVSWMSEVSNPDHSAFADSFVDGGGGHIEIRSDLDTPNRDPEWTGENFYMETCVHEMGHIIAGLKSVTAAQMTPLFIGKGDGYPGAEGTDDDWNTGGWATRIQEAVAETFKDLWLDRTVRVYANRTDWILDHAHLRDYVEYMWPPQPAAGPTSDGAFEEVRGGFIDLDLQEHGDTTGEFVLEDPNIAAPLPDMYVLVRGEEIKSVPVVFSPEDYRAMYEQADGQVQFDFSYALEDPRYSPDGPFSEPSWYEHNAAQGWFGGAAALDARAVDGDGKLDPGRTVRLEIRSVFGDALLYVVWEQHNPVVPGYSGGLNIPSWDEVSGGDAALGAVALRIYITPLANNLIQRGFPRGSGGPLALLPSNKDLEAQWGTRMWTLRWGRPGGDSVPQADEIPLPPWPYTDDQDLVNASPGPAARVRRSRA